MNSYHPRWLVPLDDLSNDLATVYGRVFQSEKLRIVRGPEGNVCLSSTHFDELEERDDAKQVADTLVRVVNGYAQLLWPGISPVESSFIVRLNPDGSIDQKFITVVGSLTAIGRGSKAMAEILFEDRPSAGTLRPRSQVVRAAMEDPEVCRVLGIFGRDVPSWPELYVVLESIEQNLGRHVSDLEWISANQRERFRATANDPWLAGEKARHGKVQESPYSNPMDLDEARELIRRILAEWLVHVGKERLSDA